MARKKKGGGNSKKGGKPKKKGGLFGWFGGKEEGDQDAEPTPSTSEIPDDFNPERTFVPEYAQDAGPGYGGDLPPGAEMTMAPGYAGGDLPFGAERTMAPGYADGDLPFGAERTMAPGYAGAGDLPPGAERTMAPGYAGAGDLPPGAERTMAPGYAGAGDLPFGAERTMAPGYAGADPFSFDANDLGGGGGAGQVPPAHLAGLKPNQSLDELNPFLVGGGGAQQPQAQAGVGAADPFGPPLLDDPYAGDPAEADDFVGERTMVDIPSDIDELADLKPTEELLAGEELDLGAAPAAAAATGTRRMYQRVSYAEDCVVYAEPDPAVEFDVARGFVFAPAVPEGWTNVPTSLALLSDGSVVGRAELDGHGTVTAPRPPEVAEGQLRFSLPASAGYDPQTRAVFVPLAAAGRIGWRPPLCFASEDGVTFTLPEGSTKGEDGRFCVPQHADAGAAPHGGELATHTYLGVREVVYRDGWACLELPPDAELSAGTLILSADGPPPPLMVAERLPDGRWQLELPMGSEEDGLSVWLPPAYGPARAAAFDPELAPRPVEQDVRHWAGVRDALLADGWIELTLPEGAEVQGRRVRLPAAYAVSLSPELQFEVTRDDDGRLSFALPAQAEVLGAGRVLLPPVDYTPPRVAAAAAASSPAEPQAPSSPRPTGRPLVPSVPTKAKAKDEASETHGAGSKTAKALDRFRSSKSDAQDADADAQDADAKDADADAQDADAKDDDADAQDADADAQGADADAQDADADAQDADDEAKGDADSGAPRSGGKRKSKKKRSRGSSK
ncbi:MAG: hypothetical protein R3F62_17465 [Planctomycetota bacterium]